MNRPQTLVEKSLYHHSKAPQTGLEISDDWYRDSCRLVEKSLTTGIEKTIPKRFLMVLIGKKIGLVSIPSQIRSILAANVTYQTRGKK